MGTIHFFHHEIDGQLSGEKEWSILIIQLAKETYDKMI
jgi:hypothetical protein